MSKATFICKDCDITKEVGFETGTKPVAPVCEKCGKEMKRKFGNVNKGRIIPDDLLYISRMMTYQSSKK
jgi:DNA replicative helicase MCM subunit Mcm2 (Cdc46/Mcm family)